MEQVYDVEYFIKKFEAIPEEEWTVGTCRDNKNRSCALGHCGMKDENKVWHVPEALALDTIFRKRFSKGPHYFNDGEEGCDIEGEYPKERILNALKEIQNYTKLNLEGE